MLSDQQLSELEVSLESTEKEKFAVSDQLRSKEWKIKEVTKTLQGRPMNEQIMQKVIECKELRQLVFKGDEEKAGLQESAKKLQDVKQVLDQKEVVYRKANQSYEWI